MRERLDVKEALRCSIYGMPKAISSKKAELYETYARQQSDEHLKDLKEDEAPQYFDVQRLITEFEIIKKVFINNAIPVDIAEIESGGSEHASRNAKGWGTRVLFDKKVFLQLL